MKVLGIETSCDESAAAVVEDGRHIVSSVIASQVSVHARYGGIVPEVASRRHLESLLPVIEESMSEAGCGWCDLAAIAVTVGPGLSGSLLVGLNTAKAISFARDLPLVGVSHLEAHIYANWLDVDGSGVAPPRFHARAHRFRRPQRPAGHGGPRPLSPAGPHSRRCRRRGVRQGGAASRSFGFPVARQSSGLRRECAVDKRLAQRLPRAILRGTYDFSFSGLKTAVLRLTRDYGDDLPQVEIAAAFQSAVVEALVAKTCGPRARRG
jgi:N6-L-threonylcarbamoyladenine synthase